MLTESYHYSDIILNIMTYRDIKSPATWLVNCLFRLTGNNINA